MVEATLGYRPQSNSKLASLPFSSADRRGDLMNALELFAQDTTTLHLMPGPLEALQAAVVARPTMLLYLTISRGFADHGGEGKRLVLSMAAAKFVSRGRGEHSSSGTSDRFQILLVGHREIDPDLASLVQHSEVLSITEVSDLTSETGSGFAYTPQTSDLISSTELMIFSSGSSSGSGSGAGGGDKGDSEGDIGGGGGGSGGSGGGNGDGGIGGDGEGGGGPRSISSGRGGGGGNNSFDDESGSKNSLMWTRALDPSTVANGKINKRQNPPQARSYSTQSTTKSSTKSSIRSVISATSSAISSLTPEAAYGGDMGSEADQRLREQGYTEVREEAKYVHNTHNHTPNPLNPTPNIRTVRSRCTWRPVAPVHNTDATQHNQHNSTQLNTTLLQHGATAND